MRFVKESLFCLEPCCALPVAVRPRLVEPLGRPIFGRGGVAVDAVKSAMGGWRWQVGRSMELGVCWLGLAIDVEGMTEAGVGEQYGC